jgi:hypothetical protein
MFTITRTRLARAAAASGLAAAALLGCVDVASAAPAADSAVASSARYTETTLNQGKSLAASNALNSVIVAPPNAADGKQRWQADSRTLIVNGVAKFGYELRNNDAGACVTDVGANARVQFRTCDTHTGTNTNNSKQVWQFRFGRTVNGLDYYFWENANTSRRLMLDTFTSEGPFPSFTVTASTLKASPGSAAEASQLFHEVRVA